MTNQISVKRESILTRAMARYRSRAAAKRGVRIGFIIDATASRKKSWEEAQVIQAKMFRATQGISALNLRLVHYGGETLTDLGWESDVRKIAAHMASVRCERGLTQINDALRLFLDEVPDDKADAVILIGDSFEEDSDDAARLATQLKRQSINIFCFIDGDDLTASTVFEKLAVDTGGTFARFGDDLPLAALCEGVALLASGGRKALRRLKNEKARLLLSEPSKT
ncbi:MAG: VWA domain-containing protein [Candidatus Thiodiazotropha sp. (ex Troendleina suluensis)]|nr:VWA domain-containing protein [Candidatus Thiodiazotropha sp. (ex Troendleina suluensis)]